MTKLQSNELNSISDALKEQLEKLGLKSKKHKITKTGNGFSFYRQCSNKECKSCVKLKINVSNSIGIISFDKNCIKHN